MRASISGRGPSGISPSPGITNPPANTWFQVSGVETDPAAANSDRVELQFYNAATTAFTATVYFDDLVIGP